MDTNGISSELFFNEADFSVVIPSLSHDDAPPTSPEDILTAPPRNFTFYVYLYARVAHQHTGKGDGVAEAIDSFFNSLDVHVEASITDPQLTNVAPAMQASSSFSPQLQHRGPASAGTGQPPDSFPFFTHTYSSRGKDAEPIFFEWDEAYCCLYPLTISVLYVKTRSNQPHLTLNFNVSYRPLPPNGKIKDDGQTEEEETNEYDTELFETIDLLSGLSDDPVFGSSSTVLHQRFVVEKQNRQTASGSFSQASQSTAHMLTLRKHVHESLAVRSGPNVKMRTTNASIADKMVMMSVELENPVDTDCIFVVDKLEVNVSNSVVSPAFSKEAQFPMTLNTLDQMVFLYNVTLLEDGTAKPPQQPQRMFPVRNRSLPAMPVHHQDERLQPQRVSIQVYGAPLIDGVRQAQMRSKWNTMLDVHGMRQKRDEPDPRIEPRSTSTTAASLAHSISVSPGARSLNSPMVDHRKHMVLSIPEPTTPLNPAMNARLPSPPGPQRPEAEVVDGIVVSFTVPAAIHVGKIFPLNIFIVNRSKHTRRFQVMVPNRKRQNTSSADAIAKSKLVTLPAEQTPVDPFMDEADFLRLYFENETHEADMICLENNVRLSPLGPSTSQSVAIRFIAVKEKLHTIDLIQLVDQDTGFVTNLRHVLEVFVNGPLPKSTH
ncbi:TRAPP trafficking subunit Trs65-domain-containing protein [Dichotomocladium elegans]|nr:TRAPP trafficking subunit Trs65-domain-containing protein [Dichotomocladium elegans]